MTRPTLAELLHWMAEMPAAFRAQLQGFPDGTCNVRAVVADLYSTIFGRPASAATLAICEPSHLEENERNRLRWILAAAHLLWHPIFRRQAPTPVGVERLLVRDVAAIAKLVTIEQLDEDEERREELIRLALRAVNWLLPGETTNEADDRFKQVDSVERQRVLHAAAQRERRAREIREAMAKKAAIEAAAKVTRE